MAFPIISDYKDALRNAAGRFATLAVTPVLDARAEPCFVAGNFAAVFKVTVDGTDTLVAVKCFVRDLPELERRHLEIARFIELANRPYFIDVGFLADEIYVNSTIAGNGAYPVATMPWIEGRPLGSVLEKLCAKNNLKGLAALTRAWARLCIDMLALGVAHGDLKPDNVLVTPGGGLTLIDYEAMFVPRLKGLRSILLGGASFQHPKRDVRHFDDSLDHFSMLVITLSLRAITIEPALLAEFCTGENIILDHGDLLAPHQSKLIARLRESPDALVRDWTERLVKATLSDPLAVAGLTRVLKRAQKVTADPVEQNLGGLFSGLGW